MSDNTNSYKTVFSVSLPLVLSMAATTVMEFTDRVFLANYSIEAIAAALPGGITAFLFSTFFAGVTSYLNVFIAQYTGAGSLSRIGDCIWQGIYFSLLAAVILIGLSFLADPLFRLGGHPLEVQRLESVYFRILCIGAGMNVLGTGLACFFSGRGKTAPVMVISVIGMAFNIPLDYALINGIWIFPEMGIKGAGIATVCSWTLIAVLYCVLIFTPKNNRIYGVISNRRFDLELSLRILRTGVPAALQFAMDVFAFTFFVFMVGRLGKVELAVTNIAFSMESIAFMPAFGFSIGLSTLVGQSLGRNDVKGALKYTRQTIIILLSYILLIDLLFFLAPQWVIQIFTSAEGGNASQEQIMDQGVIIIRIMAIFISFDALYFIFTGVLKGAGDTRFIMWSIGITSLVVMILPITIGVVYLGWGIYACWIILTLFVLSLCLVSFLRYRQGRWKTIRVIESPPLRKDIS
jgi:MATE family, multidrug efflux pump